MSAISSVTGYGASSYIQQLSSGKRINSAADDAAGLTISESLKKERNAHDVVSENDKQGIDALNIADGALGGVTDYLQRIKELSVEASSGLKTADDKAAIQAEIDQNLEAIDQLAGAAEYNTKPLLNGDTMNIASNPDGSGVQIGGSVTTTEALGLKGYNVTGNFDMSKIDNAISAVSSQRSAGGAQTNALEYAYNYSRNASEQLTGSQSRIEDLDMAKAVSDMQKENLLSQYRLMFQSKQSQNQTLLNKMVLGV